MERIAVVGCPGAGKTTFVRKLAKVTGLPVVHLDYYYHQTEHDYYHNKAAWIKRVGQLIVQNEWIMDGNYSSTYDVRFERADTIIFFDIPRRVSMHGVLRRRVQYRNKLREDMPSEWKEKANLEFLKYVWRFGGEHRDALIEKLGNVKGKKIIVFKSRAQADKYLAGLRADTIT